jgi:hypothetical protein
MTCTLRSLDAPDGQWIMVDDERFRLRAGERPAHRFRRRGVDGEEEAGRLLLNRPSRVAEPAFPPS